MKQPRETIWIDVLDNNGEVQRVQRSVALEGAPKGQAKAGPIQRCPITGRVLYQPDMVLFAGRYYSPDGYAEKVEEMVTGRTGPISAMVRVPQWYDGYLFLANESSAIFTFENGLKYSIEGE